MDKPELTESVPIMLEVIYSIVFIFFIVYFFSGLSNFYKARRILSHVLQLNIFDDGYSNELLYKKYWILYTLEAVFGHINGYPVIARVSVTIAKHAVTTIEFTFFIMKFNKIKTETIALKLEDNRPPEKIKQTLLDFLSVTEHKGYERSNISNGAEASNMILFYT